VFVSTPKERETIEKLISILEKNGLHIATKVLPAAPFYKAEGYHQDYYERKGSVPYCHRRVKRF
jgi:peptide methionine sulfoxide reductase msrA/msrB